MNIGGMLRYGRGYRHGAGATIACASGLQAVASAAGHVASGFADVDEASVESIHGRPSSPRRPCRNVVKPSQLCGCR